MNAIPIAGEDDQVDRLVRRYAADYRRIVPTDLAGVLLWCVPGLIVMVGGQALIWRAFFAGGRRSPMGLRLSMIGIGLVGLAGMAALALGAVGQGRWPVALLVIVVFGWWPAFFFWWATRPRVTARD